MCLKTASTNKLARPLEALFSSAKHEGTLLTRDVEETQQLSFQSMFLLISLTYHFTVVGQTFLEYSINKHLGERPWPVSNQSEKNNEAAKLCDSNEIKLYTFTISDDANANSLDRCGKPILFISQWMLGKFRLPLHHHGSTIVSVRRHFEHLFLDRYGP